MLKLDRSKKYLIACSGGPDSMALLDMMKDYDVIVAHVNYNARPSSLYDEEVVRKYTGENNLMVFVNQVTEKFTGNFQAAARNYRYQWFAKLVEEHECDAICVAHHKDDCIETYVMQSERNTTPEYYGISDFTVINGVKVFRPLLDFWKTELLNYLITQKIEYAIDPTNKTDNYSRNVVRKRLANLSLVEKEKLSLELLEKNQLLSVQNNNVKMLYNKYIFNGEVSNLLYNEDSCLVKLVLRQYLLNKNFPVKRFRMNITDEIIEFINRTTKARASINLPGNFLFTKNNEKSYVEENENG